MANRDESVVREDIRLKLERAIKELKDAERLSKELPYKESLGTLLVEHDESFADDLARGIQDCGLNDSWDDSGCSWDSSGC